jgi:hypothetical protein
MCDVIYGCVCSICWIDPREEGMGPPDPSGGTVETEKTNDRGSPCESSPRSGRAKDWLQRRRVKGEAPSALLVAGVDA